MATPGLLALEDGTLFEGRSIGVDGRTVGEVVFNTSMTGYQEILTDPSYCRQIVTLTYPHVGNVGANPEDEEAPAVHASGLIVRDLALQPSSWRSRSSLQTFLQANSVVAVAGLDTRRLTRLLRERGAQNGCLVAGADIDADAAVAEARAFAGLQGMDLARVVSTREPYTWDEGPWSLETGCEAPAAAGGAGKRWRVVAYDFGIKRNILRMLVGRGCEVIVVPATWSAEEVLALAPDGVFLSNGPGDPEPCGYAIAAIRGLLGAGIPMFGICLGHQLLGLAGGARTVKMKFGHHGANHPVVDLSSGAVLITSQNHGFAVDESSLPSGLRATHRSLFDGSLQGLRYTEKPAFGFQGHPEASPGPHDAGSLFDHFIELIRHRCRSAPTSKAS